MPFVSVGRLTVHVDVCGPVDAPAIVCVNPLGTNLHVWDAQAAALSERYRVIRYDMRGHGMTSLAPSGEDYAIARLADDVAALLDVLRIERAHYVGLSIGGQIGQRFAAAHPTRVDSLVLCATGSVIGSPETWNPRIEAVTRGGMSAIVDGVMERWFTPATRADRPVTVDGFRIMVERTPVAGYVGCCAAIRDADLRADDARIAARTLILAGEADPAASPATAAAMRDLIPGARLEVIPAASHLLNVEQPEAVTALIDGFLRA
jgi:3-oxoadipate enol-lactonase